MMLGTTAYLFGLLSIAIPIAIHLWSRKTRKTIPFGTIRFLREDDTQAIKSLVPTEWLLLSLRILILILLVLIMCEPLWRQYKKESALVLIDPVYQSHPNFEGLKDSLLAEVDTRWFAWGFPSISDSLMGPGTSHWELLKRLEATSTDKITVISPRRIGDFTGFRPHESSVTWVSLPDARKNFEVGDFAADAGNIKVVGVSDNLVTKYAHALSSASIPDSLVVRVAIDSDEGYQSAAEFIVASIEAINEDSPLTIELVERGSEDWLIWLKEEPTPKRRNLMFMTTKSNTQMIEEVSSGVYAITVFQLEKFLSNNFPLRLEQILGANKIDRSAYDRRELPKSQLPSRSISASSIPSEITKDMIRWFWALLLLTLLIERFLSLKTQVKE